MYIVEGVTCDIWSPGYCADGGIRERFFLIMKKMTAAAISATPITPPTTPPAIAPVFDLLPEDVGLGVVVSDAEAVDEEIVEPVDWG